MRDAPPLAEVARAKAAASGFGSGRFRFVVWVAALCGGGPRLAGWVTLGGRQAFIRGAARRDPSRQFVHILERFDGHARPCPENDHFAEHSCDVSSQSTARHPRSAARTVATASAGARNTSAAGSLSTRQPSRASARSLQVARAPVAGCPFATPPHSVCGRFCAPLPRHARR